MAASKTEVETMAERIKELATEAEDMASKIRQNIEHSVEFTKHWITEHLELVGDLRQHNCLGMLVGSFTTVKHWSFDQLLIQLESKMDPDEAINILGRALAGGVLVYSNGVISLP